MPPIDRDTYLQEYSYEFQKTQEMEPISKLAIVYIENTNIMVVFFRNINDRNHYEKRLDFYRVEYGYAKYNTKTGMISNILINAMSKQINDLFISKLYNAHKNEKMQIKCIGLGEGSRKYNAYLA